MDLRLYGQVIWRLRGLIIAGIALAIVLAVLSVAKVTHGGLVYRKPVVWQSTTTLVLTQHGFPWGRATFPSTSGSGFQFADPTRFSNLTDLYAQFANSDKVKSIMLRHGAPRSWTVAATPVPPTSATGTLPVISLAGQAYTPSQAIHATRLGRTAFLQYVRSRQESAAIPVNQRVEIQTIVASTPPRVLVPRKKTLPIIVFLAILSATFGLAFAIENARKPREVAVVIERPQELDQAAMQRAPSSRTGT